jgi:cadmium resistance protein CadD (predicted permease)
LALWGIAGAWLASHRIAPELMQRYGHWIIPVVFMVIGAVIGVMSGVPVRRAGRYEFA